MGVFRIKIKVRLLYVVPFKDWVRNILIIRCEVVFMEKVNFLELQAQIIGYGPHKPQLNGSNCDAHLVHAFFQSTPASSLVSNNTTLKACSTLSNSTVMS